MFTELRIPAGRRPLTRSEARISAIIGVVFALMLLAVVFEDYAPKRLSIIFLVVFWVPMLVLHEIGHALVAKLLGWRVREIVIGFGRDIWQGRIGETHIRIKLAPIEGYVLPSPSDARGIRLKSMLVYAAGPGIELLLLGALLFFFGWETVFNDSNEISLIALQSLAVVILIGAGFNLLPFYSEGAVSDGMGMISSPFMSDESIQLRLAAFDLREAQQLAARGNTEAATHSIRQLLRQYPGNQSLQMAEVAILSADRQDDAARHLVRRTLAETSLTAQQRRDWLHLQANVELDALEPEYLTLDLALQNASRLSPGAADLLATKGASLVLRGRNEEGGNMLADAWRQSGGGDDDARILAYLSIAAQRQGDPAASLHFRSAFELVNRSARLRRRVERLAGPAGNCL